MPRIAILSASVRQERNSHRVALFFQRFISEKQLGDTDVIDLNEYNFPVFTERLSKQKNPPQPVVDFAQRIVRADAVIIVTPEYNGGYPASLKNVIDLLYKEWFRKPVAIATVSDGDFGGSQVITSLVFSLWKIRAWVVPSQFPVPNVTDTFDRDGVPADAAAVEKRATRYLDDIRWCIEAASRMA